MHDSCQANLARREDSSCVRVFKGVDPGLGRNKPWEYICYVVFSPLGSPKYKGVRGGI